MIKEQFKKFGKGFILGAAAMATVMGASCSQPAGSSINPVPYAQPTNPDNPNGNEQEDKYAEYGGKPYDVTIGNGKYTLHTFMGKDTYFDDQEEVDFYNSEAVTYVKGLKDKFIDSLEDRPAAQAYFNEKLNDFQYITHYKGGDLDHNTNIVSRGIASIMGDIAKNAEDEIQCYDFNTFYRVIANEACKAGAGSQFDGNDKTSRYIKEKDELIDTANNILIKDRIGIDLQQAYDTNDFTAVTNFMDSYLGSVKDKIGHGVTVDDLRKVINIAITTESLGAMHDRTKYILNHTSNCIIDLNEIKHAINPDKYFAMLNKQQDNGMELC